MTRCVLVLVAIALVAGCGGDERESGRPVLRWAMDGRYDFAPTPGGDWIPRFVDSDAAYSLCVTAGPLLDTTQWEGRIRRAEGPVEASWQPASRRFGNTSCFDGTVDASVSDGDHVFCVEVVDRFDDRPIASHCQPVRVERELARLHRELRAELSETLGKRLPPDRLGESLTGLASRAERAGLVATAARTRLIGAYFLRRAGTDRALVQARRFLEPPRWLNGDVAAAWQAQFSYERAKLTADSTDELGRAWSLYRDAEREFGAVLDHRALGVANGQSSLLGRVGAVGEARNRLAAALDRCDLVDCREDVEAISRVTLAWLVLSDVDATHADLGIAESYLRESLAGMDAVDRLERANAWINLAYVRTRRNVDASDALREASRILDEVPEGDSRRDGWLRRWMELVRGEAALGAGDLDLAIRVCRGVLASAEIPRLRAWSAGCAAQAHARRGELEIADDLFDRALMLHEHATTSDLGLDVPLDSARQALDYYRSARSAIDLGRPDEAWRRLDALDRQASGARRCDDADPRLEPLREEIARLASAIEGPSSHGRREQNRQERYRLADRLQDLLRQNDGCGGYRVEAPFAGSYRAMAVDDEVFVLRRDGSVVSLYRRAAMPRRELVERLASVEAFVRDGKTDLRQWRDLLDRPARILAPSSTDLGRITVYGLHGLLQRVPLHALPVEGGWLGDETIVVAQPVGTNGNATLAVEPAGLPFFVVDPTASFEGSAAAARTYRRLFPGALVLEGEAATRAAVRDAAEGAGWLHVDAHAEFDPAFPEQSSLRLADGPLVGSELMDAAARFGLVNLSACESGRWPTTADRGAYGMAGLLARAGAGWVIASRAPLEDEAARDFNRAFYEAIAGGAEVPDAFAGGIRELRDAHPVSAWASLVLVAGASEREGGGA